MVMAAAFMGTQMGTLCAAGPAAAVNTAQVVHDFTVKHDLTVLEHNPKGLDHYILRSLGDQNEATQLAILEKAQQGRPLTSLSDTDQLAELVDEKFRAASLYLNFPLRRSFDAYSSTFLKGAAECLGIFIEKDQDEVSHAGGTISAGGHSLVHSYQARRALYPSNTIIFSVRIDHASLEKPAIAIHPLYDGLLKVQLQIIKKAGLSLSGDLELKRNEHSKPVTDVDDDTLALYFSFHEADLGAVRDAVQSLLSPPQETSP